jgi:predicted nucleotidyltransferase
METLSQTTIDPDTALAAQVFIGRVKARYPLKLAILFGSRARGVFRPYSDADIALLLRGKAGKFLQVKLELADIAYDVLLETGIRIQPLPIWEEQWEHPESYSNPRLLHNIAREGIRL